MRSQLSSVKRISQAVQYSLQGGCHLHSFEPKFARNNLRQISTPTRKPTHTAGATATNAKTDQKWENASVATYKTGHSPSIAREAPAAHHEHLAPNNPYPKNDLSSTRPARLDPPPSPDREEDGSVTLKSRGTYLYQLGKAYAGFYKTGLKNIWSNQKEYQDLRRKLRGAEIHDLVRSGTNPKLSRREFQLCLRTSHDLKKLLPFGVIFAIFFEFTPLVITMLGTAVVPYTCRIPQQVKKDLQKMLSRIEDVERRMSLQKDGVSVAQAMAYVHGLDPFGIALRQTPLLGAFLWRFWIEPRLKQRMDNIICDAILIMKEGGVKRLEPEELLQLGVNIRNVDTIKSLIDHNTLGGTQSHIPDPELMRTQKELEGFLDGVWRNLSVPQGKKNVTAGYQPESVFMDASQHAQSLGLRGPYLPPAPPPKQMEEGK